MRDRVEHERNRRHVDELHVTRQLVVPLRPKVMNIRRRRGPLMNRGMSPS